MDDAEIALGPGAGVALKVGGAVFRSGSWAGAVVPEIDWHVGEGRRGDEIAGTAWREGSACAAFGEIVVVGGDGDAETAVHAAADVKGVEGVFLYKAAGLLIQDDC